MHAFTVPLYRYIYMIGQAEKKQLMGSGENVAESTPQGIDSSYLVDYDICITVLHGAVRHGAHK